MIALPALPYLRLRFTLRSLGQARLPPYKGSLLRGAFGHALRRAVCAVGPGQPCESCALRGACVHTRLFETFIDGEPPPFLAGLATSPRPLIFEPGDEVTDYSPGDPLPFDLILVGRAVELQAFAVLSVERMAANGLGRRRHPFRLESVHHLAGGGAWRPLDLAGGAPGRGPAPPLLPEVDALPHERLTLRFLTPLRLLAQGRLQERFSFRTLAFKMLRRQLELAHFYGPRERVDWRLRPLLERASAVAITESRLTWRDWRRYSNRQQRSHRLGGLVGHLRLEGDLTPFHPLLRAAEIFHVGKGATFGLGKV